MLIVGRGRVGGSIERVLCTAAEDSDGLHATGQVSTRQQDEMSPREWNHFCSDHQMRTVVSCENETLPAS